MAKNWLQQEWQDTKDFANVSASTLAKLIQWGGIGALQFGKKMAPFAPPDQWDWSQINPKNWTEEDYERYGKNAFKYIEDVIDPKRTHGPLDFYGSWKPNVGHAAGALSEWVAPVTQALGGDPKKVAEAISADISPMGSSGDRFGLAHIGNFEKDQNYKGLQESLLAGEGPENYVRMNSNPLYKNLDSDLHMSIVNSLPENFVNKEQAVSNLAYQPFIAEQTFNTLSELGFDNYFNDDSRGEGFFIDSNVLDAPIEGGQTLWQMYVNNFNNFTKDYSIEDLKKSNILDNTLLHSAILRNGAAEIGTGDMNSVVMMPEDKVTNFDHDNVGMVQSLLGDNWNANSPMQMIDEPMFSESLPVVGKSLNELKIGGKDINVGKTLNDLMMEEYPFGDPGFVEDIKSDIATRGAAGGPDRTGPQGIEHLALHLPSTMALPLSFMVPGWKGGKTKQGPKTAAGVRPKSTPKSNLLGDIFESVYPVTGAPYHPMRAEVVPFRYMKERE